MQTQKTKCKKVNSLQQTTRQAENKLFLHLKMYLPLIIATSFLIGLQILTFTTLLNAGNYKLLYSIIILMCDFCLVYSVYSILMQKQQFNKSQSQQNKSKGEENLPQLLQKPQLTGSIQKQSQNQQNQSAACQLCFKTHEKRENYIFYCILLRKCIQKNEIKDYKIFAICLFLVFLVLFLANTLLICLQNVALKEKLASLFATCFLFIIITVFIFYFYGKLLLNLEQYEEESNKPKQQANFIQNIFIDNAVTPWSPFSSNNSQKGDISSPHDTSLKKLIRFSSSFEFKKNSNNQTTLQSSAQKVPYLKSCETQGQICMESTRNVSKPKLHFQSQPIKNQKDKKSILLKTPIGKTSTLQHPIKRKRKIRSKLNQVRFFQTNSQISQNHR